MQSSNPRKTWFYWENNATGCGSILHGIRKKKELFWVKQLRIAYPYGYAIGMVYAISYISN